MEPRDHHRENDEHDDDPDDDRPAALGRDGDGLRSAVRAAAGAFSCSLHRSARQIDEEVEGEINRDDDRGRDAGYGERTRGSAAYDFVYFRGLRIRIVVVFSHRQGAFSFGQELAHRVRPART